MKKYFSLLMAAALILSAGIAQSCSKDSGGSNGDSKKKTSLTGLSRSNLAGAKAAFITGGVAARSEGDEEEFKLYKVGIDNQTRTVTFTSDEGDTIPVITDYVRSLSRKYAVMRVRAEDSQQVCVFIIRKSDGNLFTSPKTLEYGATLWDDDDPLGMFTWDGPDGQGIDAVLRLKDFSSDSDGSLYYIGGGWSYGGMLYKIFEKDGTVEFSTVGSVGEYFKRNDGGGILTGNVRNSPLGGNRLEAEWLTPGGQSCWSEWLVNSGPEYPAVIAGSPFALSFAPDSFFTIDDINDTTNPLNVVWDKSVLSQYTVQDGAVVREVVREFSKRISYFGVTTSTDGIGLADVTDGLVSLREVCIIKNLSEGGITYVPVSEASHSSHDTWMNLKAMSDRYVYGFNPNDLLPNHNTVSRFDPLTGADIADYYTLPAEYSLQWIWTTHDDVLTILAVKDGQQVYMEVGSDGAATVYDTYDGKKVILRSAF